MYVKDHMTREPVTITKDVKISKAVDIMSKGHFHRLPIVDESGKLIDYYPQDDYPGKDRKRLNQYGAGAFCRFSINADVDG